MTPEKRSFDPPRNLHPQAENHCPRWFDGVAGKLNTPSSLAAEVVCVNWVPATRYIMMKFGRWSWRLPMAALDCFQPAKLTMEMK